MATTERRRLDRLLDAVEQANVATFRLTADGQDVEPILAPATLLSWYSYLGGERCDIVTLRQLHEAVLELEEDAIADQHGWPRYG